jgi:tetratricopeptide (TPR) repeat protein
MKTKHLILSLSLIACTALGLRAQIATSALEKKIETVLYRADAQLAAEADAELAAALKVDPTSPELLYLQGFASYAKSSLAYLDKDKKAIGAALETAEKQLAAVKQDPWKAEASALLGMISGELIGVRGGSSAMRLGPKMRERTEAAFETLPQSPRVMICHGVMFLNTPGLFGGDKKEAMRLIKRAVAAYESNAAETAPRWGHAWALAWLAQASLQTDDIAGARKAAEQALALEPDYAWLKNSVLPAIEKKAAKG